MVARRAMVVEDHPMTRGLVADALSHNGFEVTAVAGAEDAVAQFDECDPDLLVADVHLGSPPSGSELALILATRAPHLAVVLMSNYPASHLAREAKAIPAHTVVASKQQVTNQGELLSVVEAALRNRQPQLLEPQPSSPFAQEAASLTTPQMEVWRLIAAGLSNAAIAEHRGTTVAATERIVTRLFARLGVDGSASLNARVAAAREYIALFGPPDQVI
ncbi:NarL/FixJ-like response regulator [Pontimonas salivibrio]|uniref:NarL/FixJ-like response regulator n=1 Tax=Pontimonas salivibrio TaxID=1159327 RepID=A0A2L2BPX3_9MICO|nr:response regulator [Pontimonas salivibrio]AVG23721.1 NarL/FixJ-like response regulator [Pontimonas salivibrio]